VAAFHSCLEIYTPEAFPLDHKRAQEQLKECERLLKFKLNNRETRELLVGERS
jgi:hypothetical protein